MCDEEGEAKIQRIVMKRFNQCLGVVGSCGCGGAVMDDEDWMGSECAPRTCSRFSYFVTFLGPALYEFYLPTLRYLSKDTYLE